MLIALPDTALARASFAAARADGASTATVSDDDLPQHDGIAAMRVVISGGGVIDACTAYFLSLRQVEVTSGPMSAAPVVTQ
jgi:hypothetical protein